MHCACVDAELYTQESPSLSLSLSIPSIALAARLTAVQNRDYQPSGVNMTAKASSDEISPSLDDIEAILAGQTEILAISLDFWRKEADD